MSGYFVRCLGSMGISAAAHCYPASPAVQPPLACPWLVVRHRTFWVCVPVTDALVSSFVGWDCISGMADASGEGTAILLLPQDFFCSGVVFIK